MLVGMWGGGICRGQENPLGVVHTQPPPPPVKSPDAGKPVIEGADNAVALGTSRRDSRIRVDVNLVLVPATVTDPMNRLVTGLERENFQVFDNNIGQVI
jgi:Ca-activated chloride channel family protein